MLKAIAIDDEPMALKRFARIVEELDGVELSRSFENPFEALAYLEDETVDIAYVDIEMPAMNGIELTERLMEACPSLDIIMVTAHDQYALEAFQVQAVGYLLKPVELKEAQKCVRNIEKKRKIRNNSPKIDKLYVRCFGDFLCYTNKETPQYLKWRTTKTRELMGLLHHFRGQPVHRDQLLDLLWPEKDVKRATQNFHATSYYLRNQLESKGFRHIFEQKNGQYHLNMKYLDSDLYQFHGIMDKIQKAEQTTEDYMTLSLLYKGHYFEKQGYLWAMDNQERYRQFFVHAQNKLHYYYLNKKELKKAVRALERMIEMDQLNEQAYECLIDLHIQQKNYESAKESYEAMRKVFQEELGLEPPIQIAKLMKKASAIS